MYKIKTLAKFHDGGLDKTTGPVPVRNILYDLISQQ